LLVRAGWAPLAVLLLHGFFNSIVHVYRTHTWFDLLMHFAGGMAMAYFVSSCFAALPADLIDVRRRSVAQLVFAVTTTATIAVFWEFTEYASDGLFSTHALGDSIDTLQDLGCGIAGATVLMFVSWLLGRLGRYRPAN
jgi:hypothetical protein